MTKYSEYSNFTEYRECEELARDRALGAFIDGIGAAAASSGILTQLQGRVLAFLYLQSRPLSLDESAAELQQSKSNVSVNIRGLIEWHLVRRTRMGGSRKDYYEAATDFWRVMREIMERRFRWTVRQVLASVAEIERMGAEARGQAKELAQREAAKFTAARLAGLRAFFAAVDGGLGAFTQGEPFDPENLQNVLPLASSRTRQRS